MDPLPEILGQTESFENADFQLIFACGHCSASAVTPSEKSSIITNRKSTMRFPVNLMNSVRRHYSPRG